MVGKKDGNDKNHHKNGSGNGKRAKSNGANGADGPKNGDGKNGNGNNHDVFWADQVAQQVLNKKTYQYLDKSAPKRDEYVVKTSASLSGVLHIGRLSDTIRGDSVVTALKEAGAKTSFIWVAEDMDPLRKIPKGLAGDYKDYIGMPVTDIPDPDGSYPSYAAKHMEEYFTVVHDFVKNDMKKYSMREEYRKGTFREQIRKLIAHAEEIRQIQNKYRTHPLKKGWTPWKPICGNCGKIVTTRVTTVADGRVQYKCEDYEFETTTAKGCGHKGDDDPAKGNGKLVWKSEWAAQWDAWKVSSEGAGKEYQVPNSAWWINAEIAEHILDYPMPEPIFYEHLMIDGVKMSASLGNVVYPRDWLSVATPELLRLLYNKRLMTTRSFSWKDLPNLYAEYDNLLRIKSGEVQLDNQKEKAHAERLLQISDMGNIKEPLPFSFSHAALVAQLYGEEDAAVESLKKTGHYTKKRHKEIMGILEKAKRWLEHYAPPESKYVVQDAVPEGIELSAQQRKALHALADVLERKPDISEEDLFAEFYNICKELGIKNTEFFKAAYRVLLNQDRGPRLAHFVKLLGNEKVVPLFRAV